MGVTTLNTKVDYPGDGSADNFGITFQFITTKAGEQIDVFNVTEVAGLAVETLQTLGVDYEFTYPAPGPPTVVNPTSITYLIAPPPVDTTVRIKRTLTLQQVYDYINTGRFLAEKHEEGLDTLVMMIQQVSADLNEIEVDIGSVGTFVETVDSASTGNLSDYAAATNKIVFTNASMTGILSIGVGVPGQMLLLTNSTGVALNLANEDAGETAINRVSTGSGADINMADNSSVLLVYDGNSSTWRIVGGSAGAGSLLGVPTDGAYGGPIGPIAGIASGDTSEDAFDKVDTILGLLAPEPPQPLSAKTLVITGSYSALEATSGDTNPIVTDDTTPDINHGTASTLANSFRTGKRGTLSAEVDAAEVGTIALTDADNSGSNGNLTIVDDFDPYTGQFGKEGFWAGLIARIIPNALSVGAHNAQLKHTETGNSNLLSFFIDDPVTPTVGTITLDASGATSSHKSGVPGVAQGQNINVTFDVSDAVKTHYNPTRIARASSPQTSSVNETLPVTPPDADDTISADINIAVSSGAYSEDVVVTGTGYNSKGGTDTNTASDDIRVDTVGSEVRRISGTGQYPASGYGGTFDATVSLATASNFELQYLNGLFRDPPSVNYSTRTPSGPNYSSLSYDAHNSMRWATFSLGSISSASGVSFSINSSSNFGGSTLVSGIELYLRVDGATPTTGWINANSAYPGVGNPLANGDAALNVGSSSATSKVVTFGAAVKTGTVYVRIGIPDGSNKTFGSIS